MPQCQERIVRTSIFLRRLLKENMPGFAMGSIQFLFYCVRLMRVSIILLFLALPKLYPIGDGTDHGNALGRCHAQFPPDVLPLSPKGPISILIFDLTLSDVFIWLVLYIYHH